MKGMKSRGIFGGIMQILQIYSYFLLISYFIKLIDTLSAIYRETQ